MAAALLGKRFTRKESEIHQVFRQDHGAWFLKRGSMNKSIYISQTKTASKERITMLYCLHSRYELRFQI